MKATTKEPVPVLCTLSEPVAARSNLGATNQEIRQAKPTLAEAIASWVATNQAQEQVRCIRVVSEEAIPTQEAIH